MAYHASGNLIDVRVGILVWMCRSYERENGERLLQKEMETKEKRKKVVNNRLGERGTRMLMVRMWTFIFTRREKCGSKSRDFKTMQRKHR